ncbi:MAG: hypothetical protein NVS9B1_05290 [Candidatus Dormibacteraceae bacterium]
MPSSHMSLTDNETTPGTGVQPATLLAWIDGEIERLRGLLPGLEETALNSAEELAEADVIRRHVILHPERFSPHERDNVVEKAQLIAEARQRAEVAAQSIRERMQFSGAVAEALRGAVAAGEAAAGAAAEAARQARSSQALAEAKLAQAEAAEAGARAAAEAAYTQVEAAEAQAREKAEAAFAQAQALELAARQQVSEAAAAAAAAAEATAAMRAPAVPGGALAMFQAVEFERLRIARDLHDGPAQVLADLVLKAEILERIATRQPDALQAELDEFKSMVRNAVADMRRFMFDLRPDSLDDLGLVATMKRFSSEYQDRTGITCRFNVTGEERRFDPALEEAIFRIIQEALTNVQKHAGAKTAEVNLVIQLPRIALRVKDDGGGFDPAAAGPPGPQRLGLLGMRERAEALGGRLEVLSQPGQGTQIVAEFANA